MRIGEVFPIYVQVTDNPPIDLRSTELYFVVANNGKIKFTYQGDDVYVDKDEDDNYTIAKANGITRAQSLELVTGKIVIELLIKSDDPDFPDGFFTIGRFEEDVLDSITTAFTG